MLSRTANTCDPHKLRTIEQEAFLKCFSSTEVSLPPTLLYIARRAFAGCTQLHRFQRTGKSTTWRARTLEPMLSFGVTTLTCQNGFDGSHAIRKMKTNGLMTPLQLLIGVHVQSSTQLSVFAGACVLAHATEPAQLVSSKECFRC